MFAQKKAETDRKRIRKIAENQQIVSRLTFKTIKKKIDVLMNQSISQMDVNNSRFLVQMVDESITESNEFATNGQKILKKCGKDDFSDYYHSTE